MNSLDKWYKNLRYGRASALLLLLILFGCGGTDSDSTAKSESPSPVPSGGTPVPTTPIVPPSNTNILPNFGEPTGSAILATGVKILSDAENRLIAIESDDSVTFYSLPQLRVGEIFLTEKGAYKVVEIKRPDENGRTMVAISDPLMEELFSNLKISGTTHVSGWEIDKDESDNSALKFFSKEAPSHAATSKALLPGLISSFQLTDLIRRLGFKGGEMTLQWNNSSIAVDYEYDLLKGGVQKAYVAISPELAAKITTEFEGGIPLFTPEVEVFKISRPVPINLATVLLDKAGVRLARWQFSINLGFNGEAQFSITSVAETKISAIGGVDYKINQPFNLIKSGQITGDITHTAPELSPSSPTGATAIVAGELYFKVKPSIAFLQKVAIGGVDVQFSNVSNYAAEIQRSIDPGYCLTYSNDGKISIGGFFKGIGLDELRSPAIEVFNQPLVRPRKEGFCSTLSVSIAPQLAQMQVGNKMALKAQLVDADSNPLPSPTGFEWTSGNLAVATVDPSNGIVTAIGIGATSIMATDRRSQIKGSSRVTVGPNTELLCSYERLDGVSLFRKRLEELPTDMQSGSVTLNCYSNDLHETPVFGEEIGVDDSSHYEIRRWTYHPDGTLATKQFNRYGEHVLRRIERTFSTRERVTFGQWWAAAGQQNQYNVETLSSQDRTSCSVQFGGYRRLTENGILISLTEVAPEQCTSYEKVESLAQFNPRSTFLFARNSTVQGAQAK